MRTARLHLRGGGGNQATKTILLFFFVLFLLSLLRREFTLTVDFRTTIFKHFS